MRVYVAVKIAFSFENLIYLSIISFFSPGKWFDRLQQNSQWDIVIWKKMNVWGGGCFFGKSLNYIQGKYSVWVAHKFERKYNRILVVRKIASLVFFFKNFIISI